MIGKLCTVLNIFTVRSNSKFQFVPAAVSKIHSQTVTIRERLSVNCFVHFFTFESVHCYILLSRVCVLNVINFLTLLKSKTGRNSPSGRLLPFSIYTNGRINRHEVQSRLLEIIKRIRPTLLLKYRSELSTYSAVLCSFWQSSPS